MGGKPQLSRRRCGTTRGTRLSPPPMLPTVARVAPTRRGCASFSGAGRRHDPCAVGLLCAPELVVIVLRGWSAGVAEIDGGSFDGKGTDTILSGKKQPLHGICSRHIKCPSLIGEGFGDKLRVTVGADYEHRFPQRHRSSEALSPGKGKRRGPFFSRRNQRVLIVRALGAPCEGCRQN